MNRNNISQSEVLELFYYDDGCLYWRKDIGSKIKKGQKVGSTSERCRVQINKRMYLRSRLVFLYHKGYMPDIIDHINRNKLDDHIENLREANLSQNGGNRTPAKKSASKYLGVSIKKSNNRWKSQIKINHKVFHLGYFDTEIEAALSYNEAAKKHHGEFANLNQIDNEF